MIAGIVISLDAKLKMLKNATASLCYKNAKDSEEENVELVNAVVQKGENRSLEMYGHSDSQNLSQTHA